MLQSFFILEVLEVTSGRKEKGRCRMDGFVVLQQP